MADNLLLVIMATVMSAVVQIIVPVAQSLFWPGHIRPNPFVVVLVHWPAGAFIIWLLLWISYRLYFNAYP